MNGSSINDYFVRQPRCVENSPRLKSKLDDGLTAAAPGPWREAGVPRGWPDSVWRTAASRVAKGEGIS